MNTIDVGNADVSSVLKDTVSFQDMDSRGPVKKFCISCLASLVKFSCPWFLKELFAYYILQPVLLAVFLLAILAGAMLPTFNPDALHQASMPAKLFWPEILEDFERIFPTPDELEAHVVFWRTVFSRYTSRQILLHDSSYPQVLYEVVDLDHSPGISPAIRKYKKILLQLHQREVTKSSRTLSLQEAKVFRRFSGIREKDKFKKAAQQRMRAQIGQRDSFMKAIELSGLYQERFEEIFKGYALPTELTRIPFIESYFNPKAYSSAGAAGLWQFMPATARMYDLQVNSKIDERYDPFKAADSAARLLKANYEMFDSWPLAVTAYNHGPAGLLRAIKSLKTMDLGIMVRKYKGKRFGFYSRNYYAQFLAAAQLMLDYKKHFGPIEALPCLQYESVTIAQQVFIDDLIGNLSIPKDELLTLNKDLKRSVIQSKTPLPKNFVLKLPPGKKALFLAQYAKL
ncbi:MAG: transglycosylase SLT domain-containing protein [bacterium]|nr:transglycosylase SLT domain-containing protein [bacterium]